jgi:hypothetical protein
MASSRPPIRRNSTQATHPLDARPDAVSSIPLHYFILPETIAAAAHPLRNHSLAAARLRSPHTPDSRSKAASPSPSTKPYRLTRRLGVQDDAAPAEWPQQGLAGRFTSRRRRCLSRTQALVCPRLEIPSRGEAAAGGDCEAASAPAAPLLAVCCSTEAPLLHGLLPLPRSGVCCSDGPKIILLESESRHLLSFPLLTSHEPA